MIVEDNIPEVVELFQARQVKLYHACQLQDFEAYLNIEGIPSRKRLEETKRSFTPFITDEVDRVNGVWDKVFVNLADFGRTFANGGGATPNTYGPILLVINPAALSEANDIAITLRSAGASDFNREKESLANLEEVDRLFVNPMDSPGPTAAFIKFKEALRKDFHSPKATNPEINCTFPEGALPLRYIESIVVDPYDFRIFEGETLQTFVFYMMKSHNLRCELKRRFCKCDSRVALYNEILGTVFGEEITFQKILSSEKSSTEMKRWIEQMQQFNLEYQFSRFANYLQEGTIYPVLSMINC